MEIGGQVYGPVALTRRP